MLFTLLPLVLAWTDAGRRMIADQVERALAAEIPGSVAIGRIDRVGLGTARARDLRFMHPNGEVVLYVRRADIDLDLAGLLGGTIAFDGVRVDGGRLLIAVQPDGRTSLEAAFAAEGGGGEPADLALRSIHVQNFALLVRPGGGFTFDMRSIVGFVGIWQHGPPGVRVRLEAISGTLRTPELLGERIVIARADGWVHGNVEHVLDLELRARLGQEPLGARLAYFDRDETPVILELAPGGAKGGLAAAAAEVGSWFTDTLEVHLP